MKVFDPCSNLHLNELIPNGDLNSLLLLTLTFIFTSATHPKQNWNQVISRLVTIEVGRNNVKQILILPLEYFGWLRQYYFVMLDLPISHCDSGDTSHSYRFLAKLDSRLELMNSVISLNGLVSRCPIVSASSWNRSISLFIQP